MTPEQVEAYLKAKAMESKIDVSSISPYVRFFIEPLVERYRELYEKYVISFDEFLSDLYKPSSDTLGYVVLNAIGEAEAPEIVRGVVELYPSVSLQSSLLPYETRIYEEGALGFSYNNKRYIVEKFAVRNDGGTLNVTATFRAATPPVQDIVPVGYTFDVNHPDFTGGRVLSSFSAKQMDLAAARELLSRALSSLKMLTKPDFEYLLSRELNLDVFVIGPGEDLMYREVIYG